MSLRFLCNIIGHTRNRRKIRRRGQAFTSSCKRCHVQMVRLTSDSAWRVHDPITETIAADTSLPPAKTSFPTVPKL